MQIIPDTPIEGQYELSEKILMMLEEASKIPRTHCYCQNPKQYDIWCPRDKAHDVTWSEFEHHLWCFHCNKDYLIVRHTSGIFSGPIPMEIANEFGTSFNRINIKTKEILEDKMNTSDNQFSNEWRDSWVRVPELDQYSIDIENKISKELEPYINRYKEKTNAVHRRRIKTT